MNRASLPHNGDRNNNKPNHSAGGIKNTLNGHTALVVDDNPDMLRLAAAMLKTFGYKVSTAAEGAQALHHFHCSPSDLVLTDYEMPAINGYQLGRRIKTSNPETRVVIMTGLSSAAVTDPMRDACIDGWLFKPFVLKELAVLLSCLGLRRDAGAEV